MMDDTFHNQRPQNSERHCETPSFHSIYDRTVVCTLRERLKIPSQTVLRIVKPGIDYHNTMREHEISLFQALNRFGKDVLERFREC